MIRRTSRRGLTIRQTAQDEWIDAAEQSIAAHRTRLSEALEEAGLDPLASPWENLRTDPVAMGRIIRRDQAGEFGHQFPGTFPHLPPG